MLVRPSVAFGMEDPVAAFLVELRKASADEFAALRPYEPPRRDDQHFACLPMAAPVAKPPAVSASTWAAFLEARRGRSALRTSYAGQAASRGQLWAAYLQLWLAHRDDPTNDDLRARLGLVDHRRLTARRGRLARRDVEWAVGTYHTIRTPHFVLESRAAREETEALAAQLESIYWVWTQVFFPFWADAEAFQAALKSGGPIPATRRPPMRIVLFPDRAHYLHALRQVPGIEQSHGYYSTEARATLMYAGPDADQATQFHEVTHQLFSEAARGKTATSVGQKIGFWVVEGLACYMESLRMHRDYATTGGWEAPRLQYARYRLLQQRDSIDSSITILGSEEARRLDDLAAWYGRAALLVHWMLDGDEPRLRTEFLEYAARLYVGEVTEAFALPAEVDESLRAFIQVDDRDVEMLPRGVQIEELCLGRTAVTAAGLDCLGAQPQLSWLDLSGLPVGDESVARLLGTGTQLRQLNLEATQVSNAIAPLLARQAQLEELDLSLTAVGDPLIAALSDHGQLQIVWLTGTCVTDSAVAVLAGLPRLHSVDLQRTPVSEEGLAQMREKKSTLEINPLVIAPAP